MRFFATLTVATIWTSFAVQAEDVPAAVDAFVHSQPAQMITEPGFDIHVGSAVPETVQVTEVPNSNYDYIVVNRKRVLIDRKSRKVVKIY